MEQVKYIKLNGTVNDLGLILRAYDIVIVKDNRINREVTFMLDGKLRTFLVTDSIDYIFDELTKK
jgi:hypothetical protein